jgi:hypothetical protein
MDKQIVINHFGGAPKIKIKLDYAHRNVVYGWPDTLTPRILADIIRRMKANKIPVPKGWLK